MFENTFFQGLSYVQVFELFFKEKLKFAFKKFLFFMSQENVEFLNNIFSRTEQYVFKDEGHVDFSKEKN